MVEILYSVVFLSVQTCRIELRSPTLGSLLSVIRASPAVPLPVAPAVRQPAYRLSVCLLLTSVLPDGRKLVSVTRK